MTRMIARVSHSLSISNGPATIAALALSIAIATPRSSGVTIQLSPRS